MGQERINGVFAAADEDKHNGRHAQYKDVLKTGPGFRVDDEGGIDVNKDVGARHGDSDGCCCDACSDTQQQHNTADEFGTNSEVGR